MSPLELLLLFMNRQPDAVKRSAVIYSIINTIMESAAWQNPMKVLAPSPLEKVGWGLYFIYTAIPLRIISSYKGDGLHSSINTGSIDVSMLRVASHNEEVVSSQSPLSLGMTTATSISLSFLASFLLHNTALN